MEVLTTVEMERADRLTIAAGTPGFALMLSAGQAVAEAAASLVEEGPILVVAGGGNNGGDGFVAAAELACLLYTSFRLGPMLVEVVPNGYWPLDFGGWLGEPVTRGLAAKLPWLNRSDDAAAIALKAVGLPAAPSEANQAFIRK